MQGKRQEKWTEKDKEIFMEAVRVHGRDYKKISECFVKRSKEALEKYSRRFVQRYGNNPSTKEAFVIR